MSNVIPFDYRGQTVRFNADGWINATEAAAKFGKRPNEWLRLPDTLEYLDALERTCGKIPYVRTSRARADRGGGTWLHPKLAVAFARWLSADFAVWADLQIDGLIRSGIVAQGHEHILALLVRPEPAEWELRFPPEYYQALAKVTRTQYSGHAGGTPGLYGQITRKWIYQVILPRDVLAEMDARKRDSEKMHQWLTDGGAKLLDQQIALVTLLAETSCDFKDFEARCMQRFGIPGQLRLVYPAAA